MIPHNYKATIPKELKSLSKKNRYAKGEIIRRPYDDSNFLYAISSGVIKIYSISPSGEEFIHSLYGKGDLFPLGNIVNGLNLAMYYQAITDCTIELFPAKDFLASLDTNAKLTHEVLRQVVDQINQYKTRVDNLEYRYARERLAYRILLLSSQFGRPTELGHIVLPAITQEDIARSINLTRESVSRGLKRLERLGHIKTSGGAITILSAEGLINELGAKGVLPIFAYEVIKAQKIVRKK